MAQEKIFEITLNEQKAIFATHNKTEDEIQEYVQHMKDWMMKQYHLPEDEDEKRLRMLLIFNKFSLEKTKKKLDTYYSAKHLVPEIYMDREPLNQKMKAMLDTLKLCPLPRLNHDLCRVYVFRFDACGVEQFDTTVFNRLFFGTLDLRMVCDPCLGDHYIADYRDAKFGHLIKITPVYLKKNVMLIQKAYSDRIKGIHFMNLPPGACTVVNVLNTLLSAKIVNRIHVHSDFNSLHQQISKEILPTEYGGTYGSPLNNINDDWKTFLKSKNSWFAKEAARRSDENKRVGEPFDTDLFGMHGSFRQLKVD